MIQARNSVNPQNVNGFKNRVVLKERRNKRNGKVGMKNTHAKGVCVMHLPKSLVLLSQTTMVLNVRQFSATAKLASYY